MNNLERSAHVHQQLERRREVLAQWTELGFSSLPEGTSVPVSLNQVRQWEDVCLGISRIGSASSFTTTHRVHGAVVRDIDRLLRELAEQRAARGKRKKARGAKLKRRLAVLESSLSGAANRHATLSVERHETELQLRVAEHSVAAFKRENSDLRTEVRHLKVELARCLASNTVPPIASAFRDPP